MVRALLCVMCAATAAACTLLDSVDGYEGRGVSAGATAGIDAGGGAGGSAGVGGAAGASASCSFDPECDDDDLCTDDACWAGGCINSPIDPTTIPDDNTCTDDFCDPDQGIQHVLPTTLTKQVLQCGTVVCPAGYFVRKLTCIPECGACNPSVCVNGVLCELPCEPEVQVCCGNECTDDDCPSGYSAGATSSTGDCGCGPGPTLSCTR